MGCVRNLDSLEMPKTNRGVISSFINQRVEEAVIMMSAKEEVRRILEQIPEDVSFEDIQYHIYVRQQIARGLEDIDSGDVVGEEEAERRMSKWLEP